MRTPHFSTNNTREVVSRGTLVVAAAAGAFLHGCQRSHAVWLGEVVEMDYAREITVVQTDARLPGHTLLYCENREGVTVATLYVGGHVRAEDGTEFAVCNWTWRA